MSSLICAAAMAVCAVFASNPTMAGEAALQRGDAAVTGFSGTTSPGDGSGSAASPDVMIIDRDSPSLRVLDVSRLGGKADGRLADTPLRMKVHASEIGQVFGVTTDGNGGSANPNIYATATSLYGLQIVRAGKGGAPLRLVRGEPGAQWMDAQFGPGGGPGSVWKIDGRTGRAKLFATITHDGQENAGPGLGAIAYDPTSRQFFVTDLETGLIHRLALDGNDKGTFDHGADGRPSAGQDPIAHDPARRMSIESSAFSVEDPATWGYADRRRMVFAVTVQGGRLYYSIAEGPQVWSVGINSDGSFAEDARRELEITGGNARSLITAIQFDGPNRLLLAQRGEITASYDYSMLAKPDAALVLAYAWSERDKAWGPEPEEFAIGMKPTHRSGLGGLALGYGYDTRGNIDYGKCRQTLWSTGEHLRDGDPVHGLQGNAKSLAKPQKDTFASTGSAALIQSSFPGALGSPNDPPEKAWFADADGSLDHAEAYGHVGAVAILSPCDSDEARKPAPAPERRASLDSGTPSIPVPAKPGVYIYKTCFPAPIGGEVRCRITVQNIGLASLSAPVGFSDVTTMLGGPGAGGAVIIASHTPDAPGWTCAPTPTDSFSCSLEPAGLAPGAARYVDVMVDTGPMAAAGGLMFRNCASLTAPWSGTACDEAGAEIEIEKTVKGPCVQGGDCTFTLTITNTGKSGFEGDVLLTDGMTVSGGATPAAITDISPALGCSPDPVSLPFSCVAPVSLAAGASVSHDITVTMPADPAGYTAKNCFAVTDTKLGPADPADPFDGGDVFGKPGVAACVEVDVAPSNIMPVVHKPKKAAACIPGHNERRTASGACVCEPGHARHKGVCVPFLKPHPLPLPQCTPKLHEVRNAHGQCVCAPGFTRAWNGRCVVPPKHCPHGTYGKYPHCKPIVTPKCPHGTTGLWPVCKKIEDKHCPKGTFGKYPDCKPIVHPKCPEGTTGVFPKCRKIEVKECPKGTIGKYPVCVPVTVPKCPAGTTGFYPNCKKIEAQDCPKGTIGKYPLCVPVTVPKCPAGTTGFYPNCKKIEAQHCPKGTIGLYPNCKDIVLQRCPQGTIGKFPSCRKIVIDLHKDLPKVDKIEPRKTDKPRFEPKHVEPRKLDKKVFERKSEKPKLEMRKLELKRSEPKKIDAKPAAKFRAAAGLSGGGGNGGGGNGGGGFKLRKR